jgi:hypothetical protein
MSLHFTEYDRSHSLAGVGRSLLCAGLAASLLTAAAVAGAGDDCNGNGVDDAIDIASGTSEDCQGDGAPDECQITDAVRYAYDSGATRTVDGPTPSHGVLTRFLAAGVFPFIGGVEFDGLVVPPGTQISGGLWSDPDGDGEPDDATLLAVGSVIVRDGTSGQVTFAEGVDVGSDGTSFFVGIWFDGLPGGRFGLDQTSVARQSWRLIAGKSFDPNGIDLMVRQRTRDVCPDCDGDWTIRAIACDQPWCATGADVDGNDVPDACQDDCNGNAIPDEYELAQGDATDCNENTILDECETLDDCDGDGIVDVCTLRPGTGLLASYWLNDQRLGPADVLRIDPMLQFDSDFGETPEGFIDYWSAEWRGVLTSDVTGPHVIRFEADDWFRMWIDDQLVLGQSGNPTDQGSGSGSVTLDFIAGVPRHVRATFNERGGRAKLAVFWTAPGSAEEPMPTSVMTPAFDGDGDGVVDLCSIGDCNRNGIDDATDLANGLADCNGDGIIDSCQPEGDCNGDLVLDECIPTGDGLLGTYHLSDGSGSFGNVVAIRVDPTIDFEWGSEPPAPGVPTDRFAVRWTGTLRPTATGSHAFEFYADDGVRLWFDDELVIDEWHDNSGGVPYTFQRTLAADGRHAIRIEYYENGGSAKARFLWRTPGASNAVVVPDSNLESVLDRDGDGVDDACMPDCDQDGVSDVLEIADGTELDCNGNGVPDACDLAFVADPVVGWWRFENGEELGTDRGPLGLTLDDGNAGGSGDVPSAIVPRTGDADTGSASFNGGSRLFTLDPDRRLSLVTEAFTAEAWVRLDQLASDAVTPAQRQWLFQRKNPTSDGRVEWAFLVQAGNIHEVCDYGVFGDGPYPTGRQLAVVLGTGSANADDKWCVLSAISIEDTGWHHVSMAWDPLRQEVRFELDGQVDVQRFVNKGLNPNGHRFAIGAHVNESGNWNQGVRGLVDEARIRRGIVPLDELLDRPFEPASSDDDGDGVPDECDGEPCPGDLDGNGVVSGSDLGILFVQWGGPGTADLDANGIVNGSDLGLLFVDWGECP